MLHESLVLYESASVSTILATSVHQLEHGLSSDFEGIILAIIQLTADTLHNPRPNKGFQQLSKRCSNGDRPKISLDGSRRMDFRYRDYVRFLP